jgi:hypothetical protein
LDIHGVRGIGYNGIQVLNFEGAASPYDDAILSFAIQGSNYRGMRLPRMTTASRNLISSPQTGLIIDNQSINNPQYRGASGWLDFALIEGPKTSRRFAYFNDNGYLRQTDYLTLYDTINNTDIKALAQFLNIISFDDNILISLRSPDYDLGGSIFNSSLFFVNKNKYSIPRTPKFTFFLGNTTQTNWQSSDRLGGFHITISASTNENDGTALLNGRSFWVNPDREVVIFDTPNWAPLTDAEIGNGFKMWSSGKVPHFRANGNTIKLQKSPTVPATLAEVITLLTNAGFC